MFAHLLSAVRSLRPTAKQPAQARRRLRLESLEGRIVPTVLPAAPVFTPATYSSTQINLSWQAVAGATSYQIEEVVNGAWRQIGSFSGATTGVSVSNLSANTTYEFDVVASNSAGSHWGTQKFATTSVAVNHPTATTAYTPVYGTLFGSNGPSFLDVRQGAVGDCWLLASLAEVAARNPNDIRSMFSYAGTAVESGVTVSLYNVRLYNPAGQAKYYTVDTELPAGGGTYDHPTNGVLWVALAEKAYAQANGARMVTTGQEGSDSYAALNEGNPAWALQAITGRGAGLYNVNPSSAASALNAGEFVVLGSSATHASSFIVGSPSEGTHAYAVVGYNASSSNPFEIFNPWGTASNGMALGTDQGRQVYGLVWVSAAFLSQNFASQAIGSGDEAGAGDAGAGSGDGAGTVFAGMTPPAGSGSGLESAWADGAMTQNLAPQATNGRADGDRPNRAADTLPFEALMASYGVTGKDSSNSHETDARSDGSHSLESSSIDAVWMEAGSPASANYLASSLFAARAL